MKTRLLILSIVGLVAVAALAYSNSSFADHHGEDKPAPGQMPSAEDMQKMMQEWAASMQPGEEHKRLAPFVGDYNVTMTMNMPGSPPVVNKGTSSVKWVLGERYLMEEMNIPKMMMGPGMEMPYSGIGMTGFNKTRNLYEGTWASSMDTHIYTMAGTWPPNSKVINYYGTMDEPMLNMYNRMCNYRMTLVDGDTHLFEVFDLAVAPDHKVFEIRYERK